MSATPENRLYLVKEAIGWVSGNPDKAAFLATVYTAMITGSVWIPAVTNFLDTSMHSMGSAIGSTSPFKALNEISERNIQKIEAEQQVKRDALKADFEATDGVDRTKTAERSWLLTVTRPSSVLGGSTPEILARVTERIVRETGCKGVLIAEAYVDRGSGLFYTPKSPVYSVAAVNCPQ